MANTTALITGASTGIGAIYADRLARRGHDLILVARDGTKLAALAQRLRVETGVTVDVLPADLADAADLATVERRLRDDASVTMLVNNAGIAGEGPIASADPAKLTGMIDLNVTAVVRLTAAIAPRLTEIAGGTIINITSVTALMPDGFTTVYPATKAFVLAFSEALQVELGSKGVRVQAVLPGITRTAIWADGSLDHVPAGMIMEADAMVDAALAGLDMGETVTIPSMPDMADYAAMVAARRLLQPNLSRALPADRYTGVAQLIAAI